MDHQYTQHPISTKTPPTNRPCGQAVQLPRLFGHLGFAVLRAPVMCTLLFDERLYALLLLVGGAVTVMGREGGGTGGRGGGGGVSDVMCVCVCCERVNECE